MALFMGQSSNRNDLRWRNRWMPYVSLQKDLLLDPVNDLAILDFVWVYRSLEVGWPLLATDWSWLAIDWLLVGIR